MTTYDNPEPEVLELVLEVMRAYHEPLADAGVRVGVLMASNPDGPAIKRDGYKALASIKVVSLKDRLKKHYDAELLLDAREWGEMRPAHHRALLDHELSHVKLKKHGYKKADDGSDDRGEIWYARDSLERPKLVLVNGDWNAGDGFAAVVLRHQGHAIEFMILRDCMARADLARKGEGKGK